MTVKTKLKPFCVTGLTLSLTFVIPTIMWFVRDVLLSSRYNELAAGAVVIICSFFWNGKTRAFPLLSSSALWRFSCFIGCLITLVLLFINLLNSPIARITGQARLPLSVISVIVLLPIAEELIFRGFIWALFEKLSSKYNLAIFPLLGTSLMFGLGHLGYWLQSYCPLPPDAVVHVLLMVAAGLGFGAVRMASGSLVAPMVVHMGANGTLLLFQ